jgi:hypothetical protein
MLLALGHECLQCPAVLQRNVLELSFVTHNRTSGAIVHKYVRCFPTVLNKQVVSRSPSNRRLLQEWLLFSTPLQSITSTYHTLPAPKPLTLQRINSVLLAYPAPFHGCSSTRPMWGSGTPSMSRQCGPPQGFPTDFDHLIVTAFSSPEYSSGQATANIVGILNIWHLVAALCLDPGHLSRRSRCQHFPTASIKECSRLLADGRARLPAARNCIRWIATCATGSRVELWGQHGRLEGHCNRETLLLHVSTHDSEL